MRGAFVACLACALLACGGPPRARRHGSLSARARPSAATGCEIGEAESPRACAVARVDVDAGVVEVTLTVDPAALPAERSEVRLAFCEDVLGARYGAERADLLSGAWALGAAPTTAEVRYRVTLPPSASGPGASFRRPGGWHLTGSSFLPDVIVDGAPADVPASLLLDTGDAPLWTAAGSDRRLFDAPSLRRLADEAYEVGALSTTRRDVGGTTLLVGTSVEDAAPERAADVFARALAALSQRLGPPPADALLVVLHPGEAPARVDRRGASLVYRGPEPDDPDPLFAPSALAIAELVRFWAPGTHAAAEPWIAEGVAAYLSLLVSAELAGAPAESVARAVLTEPGAADDAKRLGMVAAFCLDAHLSDAGSTLGAVLRTTLARDDDEVLGAEALLEDLAAVSPEGASYLAALLDGGAPALDECLERSGFRAREVSYEGATDAAVQRDLLGAVELGPSDPVRGIVIVSVDDEASALEGGDVLREVAGVRVGSLGDVAWALRDAAQGGRVRVVVRRRGEPVAIELEVPPLEREQRAYVELAPVEDEADAE